MQRWACSGRSQRKRSSLSPPGHTAFEVDGDFLVGGQNLVLFLTPRAKLPTIERIVFWPNKAQIEAFYLFFEGEAALCEPMEK